MSHITHLQCLKGLPASLGKVHALKLIATFCMAKALYPDTPVRLDCPPVLSEMGHELKIKPITVRSRIYTLQKIGWLVGGFSSNHLLTWQQLADKYEIKQLEFHSVELHATIAPEHMLNYARTELAIEEMATVYKTRFLSKLLTR